MMRAGQRPLAVHPRAGTLAARRLGVRYRAGNPGDVAAVADTATVASPVASTVASTVDLASRSHNLGPLTVTVNPVHHGRASTIEWNVHNPTSEPVGVDSVILGARWTGRPPGPLRFLRHGWQSWSFSGFRALDKAGEPAFPAGAWMRGMHHALGERPADRAGWHESATVTVAGVGAAGPVCLCGALERGRGFAVVYLRASASASSDSSVDVDIEIWLEVPLAPGETRSLEDVRFALGDDENVLLERYAGLWGKTAGARTGAPLTTGWCSWYHYFHRVTEADVLANLRELERARADRQSGIAIDVVQLDDGYQRAVGDWLTTNERFPRGLAPLAADIRAAGFRPGIWTAPFCVVAESQLFTDHPDWLLRKNNAPFPALMHGDWSKRGWVHALDTTRPEVIEHLTEVFAALTDMGWTYHKLDFLYSVAMSAVATDATVTRAERLQRGLMAIRAGAGDDAYLLGCGCPLGPAVGVVDAMRVGPDVAPHWEVRDLHAPGMEPVVASARNAIRGVVHRMWMHRRLWINDPDCLISRTADSDLSPAEMRTLSAVIAASGGLVVFSDEVAALTADDRARVREVADLARRVDSTDATGPLGAARALGWRMPQGQHDTVEALVARRPQGTLVAALNTGEEETTRALDTYVADGDATDISSRALTLEARDSVLAWRPDACDLAVFCDFDGTLITSDVTIEIMRRYRADRLRDAWRAYHSGAQTIWEIVRDLADGLETPESELVGLLAPIELDPGGRALIDWCQERAVPFRVVSDGFDLCIERLLERFGIACPIDANHLQLRDDAWRLAPGAPDPACGCGCGVCKRSVLSAWRAAHPRALCVFIGNGRISDLCGAETADWVFAKDKLAEALDARGVAYQPFADLGEVAAALAGAVAPIKRTR